MEHVTWRFGFFSLIASFCLAASAVCAQNVLAAAREGDVETLTTLLAQGGIPDAQLERGLYFAAQRGHGDVVMALLNAGVSANVMTKFGTPLQIASRNGHMVVIDRLLAAGANPNLGGGENETPPILEAAERGKIDAARRLLAGGADVNLRNKYGHSALHMAVRKDRTAMARFLETEGASPISVALLAPDALEAADIEAGRIRAIECGQCHATEIGTEPVGNLVGPDLFGIVGRKQASLEGYAYSEVLLEADGYWTLDALNAFLADPTGRYPGTSMEYGGDDDPQSRVNLIAYLTTLSN